MAAYNRLHVMEHRQSHRISQNKDRNNNYNTRNVTTSHMLVILLDCYIDYYQVDLVLVFQHVLNFSRQTYSYLAMNNSMNVPHKEGTGQYNNNNIH